MHYALPYLAKSTLHPSQVEDILVFRLRDDLSKVTRRGSVPAMGMEQRSPRSQAGFVISINLSGPEKREYCSSLDPFPKKNVEDKLREKLSCTSRWD